MKHVDQETGRELEQSEIQHHGGGRGDRGGSRPPIELGAILNAKCTRCGGQGHLAVECFNTSGTRYDLIPEEPEMRGVVHGADSEHHHPQPHVGRGATMPSWMTDPGYSKDKKKQLKKAAKHERKARKKMKKERKKVSTEQLLFNFLTCVPLCNSSCTQHGNIS